MKPPNGLPNTEDGAGTKDEVELYRWPFSQQKVYLTRGAMLRKLVFGGIALAGIFGLGALWMSLNEPRALDEIRAGRTAEERRQGKEAIKQCCLTDIRTAQEALTNLSVEAKKLRVHLGTNSTSGKDASSQKLIASMTVLEEQPRALWDQLESLVDDSSENRRRLLRDIKITLEGLKEHFGVAETCCGLSAGAFPTMKVQLQITEYRFQVLQSKIGAKYAGVDEGK